VARRRRHSTDDDLIALVGEYSDRRIYRPVEEVPEPGEVPAGGSGTAVSTDAPATRDDQDQSSAS
jgi:hypothetical protein